MNEDISFLGTEKVSKLMAKYAIPCIISLLVGALYNIVDQLFIANASYLGSYGNAANTVVYPLTVVALAVAVMIGDGCCSYTSICLGANEKDNANKGVGNAILSLVTASVIITAIYFIFQHQILILFGGGVNELTYANAKEYFTFISIGIPFYMLGQGLNPIVRSDGSPNRAMAFSLCGAAVNIVLDPVFIYVFKWGMMGAALATILGQILTCILSVLYIRHMKLIHLTRESFTIKFRIIGKMLSLGVCSLLSQISIVFSMAAVQNMLTKYGALDPVFGLEEYAQIPMAVVGIVMKFYQIVISIVIGLSSGNIPVVGYSIGAGKNGRAKEIFKLLLICEAIVGFIGLAIFEVFPSQLIGLFGASNESSYYMEFGIKTFRIYMALLPLSCVNKAVFIFLQAIGKAFMSTLLSLIREIVFGVGFVIILPIFFGLTGVLLFMPVADLCTFIIGLVVIVQTFRELSTDKTMANV
ncbi:MAG: MATE family efflux transporter [Erysipelotrichaceae bacterium]|nr:MATE family efflux transporter [Erysipelotrichaceae bacterium]